MVRGSGHLGGEEGAETMYNYKHNAKVLCR